MLITDSLSIVTHPEPSHRHYRGRRKRLVQSEPVTLCLLDSVRRCHRRRYRGSPISDPYIFGVAQGTGELGP